MKYIENPKINIPISKIGIGTGRFGTKVPKEVAFEMLDLFYEKGGNVVDTARNYYEWVPNGRGASERCIGEWLETKERTKICISTKGGVRNEGKTFFYNLSKHNLENEIKESLDSLRTEYIDIYLLHRDEPDRPVEEIVETMQRVQEIGNVSQIGVANWEISRVKKANEYANKNGLIPFSIIQTWWSLAEYTDAMWNDSTTTHMDEETYQYMLKHKLVGMAYTSQCKGFFQKAIMNGIEGIDPFLYQRIVTPTNMKKLEYIREYCNVKEISPTAFVNGYITSNELEGIALVSVSNINQLQDILDWCDYELPQEAIKDVDHV